jgi:hypothetical protein
MRHRLLKLHGFMTCMVLGALELGFQNRSGLVLLGPTSLTHQFQAKPCRCCRQVASIVERIDLGCVCNLMGVLISLTAAYMILILSHDRYARYFLPLLRHWAVAAVEH